MCAHWCTWLVGSAHAAQAVKNVAATSPARDSVGSSHAVARSGSVEQRHVAVQVEEAAAEHVARVHVVDTERAQWARPYHRPGLVPPRIGDPVDDAGHEVGDHAGGQHHDWQPPGQTDCRANPDHQQCQRSDRRDEAGEFHGLRGARAGREDGRGGGARRLRVSDEDGPKLHGSPRRPPPAYLAASRARAFSTSRWKTNSGLACPLGILEVPGASAALLHPKALLQVVDDKDIDIFEPQGERVFTIGGLVTQPGRIRDELPAARTHAVLVGHRLPRRSGAPP